MIDGRGRELANNFINQVYSGVIKDKLQLGRVANRPKLVYFRECKNVEIKGVTMMNPAFWTQTYDQCENLLIDGITVHSRAYWNNDGMDIVDCNGALIQNCYVDATDDAICLKSIVPMPFARISRSATIRLVQVQAVSSSERLRLVASRT